METLPEHLFDIIIDRLDLPDLYRLGYTCKSFYSKCGERCPLQYGNHLPWLIVPIKNASLNDMAFGNKDEVGFCSLCNGITYTFEIEQLSNRRICGSLPGGWLMTVHENSEIQLYNPFYRGLPLVQLPPLNMFPGVDETIEVTKQEGKHLYHATDITDQHYCWDSMRMRDYFIQKVAMSSSSLSYGTVIMAIQGRTSSLAFYKIGECQKVWTPARPEVLSFIHDVTYYQGNFYAIHNNGYVVVIRNLETEKPQVSLVIPQNAFYSGAMKYILVSGGDLLVVHRTTIWDKDRNPDKPPYRTVGFKVLKIKFGCTPVNQWEEVNNLGDRALFLGYNSSLSLSSAEFSGCRPNSIYFTDDFGPYSLLNGYGGYDLGIYSLEDRSIHKLISPADCLRAMPPPIWYTPN